MVMRIKRNGNTVEKEIETKTWISRIRGEREVLVEVGTKADVKKKEVGVQIRNMRAPVVRNRKWVNGRTEGGNPGAATEVLAGEKENKEVDLPKRDQAKPCTRRKAKAQKRKNTRQALLENREKRRRSRVHQEKKLGTKANLSVQRLLSSFISKVTQPRLP